VSDDEEKVYPAIGADLNPSDCRPGAPLDGEIVGARADIIKGESEIPGVAIFFEGSIYWLDDGYQRDFVAKNDRPSFDESMKNFIEQLRAILLHPDCDRARVRAEFEKSIQVEGSS
jgi:hypothetical protein